jgi:hypothetical protein
MLQAIRDGLSASKTSDSARARRAGRLFTFCVRDVITGHFVIRTFPERELTITKMSRNSSPRSHRSCKDLGIPNVLLDSLATGRPEKQGPILESVGDGAFSAPSRRCLARA